MVSANSPAPTSVYYEVFLAAIDLLLNLRAYCSDKLPAGHFRSVCVTYISDFILLLTNFTYRRNLSGGWVLAP
jgi:hypothetical protein